MSTSTARPTPLARAGDAIASYWARPELRWLAAILLLAAVLRVVWALYAAREPQGLHDPVFYFDHAANIAKGNSYAFPEAGDVRAGYTAYYPIGYPAALAGVFALVTHTYLPDNLPLAAAFFNVALSIATVGLVYVVAQRLFDATVGLVAAFWFAAYPNVIFHMTTVLSETLFLFLVMVAMAVLLHVSWRDRRLGWVRLALFALLIGLATLVRPIAAVFLPILPVVWLLGGFGWRRTATYSAVVGAVFVAVLTPWAVRNAIVMDKLLLSTNTGDNLCMGHNPQATGQFQLPETCFDPEPYAGLTRSEFEVRRDEDNTETAIEFALDHPVRELELLSRKAYHTWEHDHDGLRAAESYGDDPFIPDQLATALRRVADNYFYFTISVGALGLVGFVVPPRDPRRVYTLLALLAMAGSPLPFFGDARFHVPTMPFLIIAAAWIAVFVVRWVARQDAQERRQRSAVEISEGERSVSDEDALQDA